MTSIDNGVDVPPSSRLSQVGNEILADEARRGLTDPNAKDHLKLVLPPSAFDMDSEAKAFRDAANGKDVLPGPIKIPGQPAAPNDRSQMVDGLADKLYPGFGRFESDGPGGPGTKWRFDYLDPSRCTTKADVGLCFKLNFR
jgi:hypothetical protein